MPIAAESAVRLHAQTSFTVSSLRHMTANRRLGLMGVICCVSLLLTQVAAWPQDSNAGSWWQSLQGKKGHVTGNLNERFSLDDANPEDTPSDSADSPSDSADTPSSDDAKTGSTGINPSDPGTAQLIRTWISTAEPPPNATDGSNLHYTFGGRMVGTTPSGIITSRHESGNFDPVNLWTNWRTLDSVDHCTMEQYVRAKLVGVSIANCTERYKPIVKRWVGLQAAAALKAVRILKLKATFKLFGPAPEKALTATIARQEPEQGTALSRGQSVRLYVYTPPAKTIKVPDFIGMKARAAVQFLKNIGLKAQLKPGPAAPSPGRFGSVYRQTPAAGAILNPGATISLQIYSPVADQVKDYEKQRDEVIQTIKACRFEEAKDLIDAIESIDVRQLLKRRYEQAIEKEKIVKKRMVRARNLSRSCQYEAALDVLSNAQADTQCEQIRTNIKVIRKKTTLANQREIRTKALFKEANQLFLACKFDAARAKLTSARQNTQCSRYTRNFDSAGLKIDAGITREGRTRQLFNDANRLFKKRDYEASLSKLEAAKANTKCDRYVSRIDTAVAKVKAAIGENKPAMVRIPDVTGRKTARAERDLEVLGLKVEVRKTGKAPSAADAGTVIRSRPEASQSVPVGSLVSIDVFGAYQPQMVVIPDIIGLNINAAKARLAAVDLKAKVRKDRKPGSLAEAGIIYGSIPEYRTKVNKDSLITLLAFGDFGSPPSDNVVWTDAWNGEINLTGIWLNGKKTSLGNLMRLVGVKQPKKQSSVDSLLDIPGAITEGITEGIGEAVTMMMRVGLGVVEQGIPISLTFTPEGNRYRLDLPGEGEIAKQWRQVKTQIPLFNPSIGGAMTMSYQLPENVGVINVKLFSKNTGRQLEIEISGSMKNPDTATRTTLRTARFIFVGTLDKGLLPPKEMMRQILERAHTSAKRYAPELAPKIAEEIRKIP